MSDPTKVEPEYTFILRMSFTFATLKPPHSTTRKRIIDRELADITKAFEFVEFGPTMNEESFSIRVVEAAPHVVHRVTQETNIVAPNAKRTNDQIKALQSANWRSDCINVHFVHSIGTEDGRGLRGLTISPVISRKPNGILAVASLASRYNVAHELGHFLLNTGPGVDDHDFDEPDNLMHFPEVTSYLLDTIQGSRIVQQLRADAFLKGVTVHQ